MRVWSALVLLSVTALASAQVYRSVAPDGSVQFSDYPLTPNATVIEVQPAQTVPMGAGARPPAPVAAKVPVAAANEAAPRGNEMDALSQAFGGDGLESFLSMGR